MNKLIVIFILTVVVVVILCHTHFVHNLRSGVSYATRELFDVEDGPRSDDFVTSGRPSLRLDSERAKTVLSEPSRGGGPQIVWTWWENKTGTTVFDGSRSTVEDGSRSKKLPDVVQRCLKNWVTRGQVKDLRLLNPKNVGDYIPGQEYQKICALAGGNLAIKSDFIGLYLISKWGGTWIDATAFFLQPLSAWCVESKPLLFRARRYSKDSPCIETFFLHGPPNYPFFKKWYEAICKVAPAVDQWCEDLKTQYPNIAAGMEYGNYLWVYLVGKKLIMDDPSLIKDATILDSEDSPWKESIQEQWRVPETCAALAQALPNKRNLVKLDNELRKKCNRSIIPIT